MTTNMRCLLLLTFLGLTVSQYLTPPQSYEATNYQLDDSPAQETIDPAGNIQGQYNYINPRGKTINVQYIDAKDGFRSFGQHSQPNAQLPSYYQPLKTKSYQPSYPQQSQPAAQLPSYYQPLKTKTYQPSYPQYNQQEDEQFGQGLQAYQSQDIYQAEEYQPNFRQPLFSPAADPYPAHTAGQVKSMMEYLEEETKDLEKERKSKRYGAQAHVSVSSPNMAYSYKINL